MSDNTKAFTQSIDLLEKTKNEPNLLTKLTEAYFDPKNGYVSQQYADWVASYEYAFLRSLGIHLNVNEHTTSTPIEILQEFENIYSEVLKKLEDGTIEEMDLDSDQ